MINLIEDLTEKALLYSLIGTTLRVYSWTTFSVFLFLLFRSFDKYFKEKNLNIKYHYSLIVAIPLGLINAIIYSINIDVPKGVLFVDVVVFFLGFVILISILLIYLKLKGSKNGA